MSGFIQGQARNQSALFPEYLDDFVAEESAVRLIDLFIDELNLSGLGFNTIPNSKGRPAYHPAVMLKIFIYGYFNRIASSRRLEQEAQRNIELMWLVGRLAPDFKTIADFRKNNGEAIRLVCREFVMLCKKFDLFKDAFIAIDGSKFKAVNNRDKNFTRAKMKRRLVEVDASIDRYLGELAKVDDQESASKTIRIKDRINALKAEMTRLKTLEIEVLESPDKQVSLTDPDARSMKSRGSGIVGYNVQTAVDVKHHLIINHLVTNEGSDRNQLSDIAKQTKEVLGVKTLDVVADRGYYKGEELLACEQAGITPYVPKPLTSNNRAKGLFDKSDFIYKPDDNEYECPAGERLTYRATREQKGKILYYFYTTACHECPIKSKCTTASKRQVTRWEHEDVMERVEAGLEDNPDMMKIRRAAAEHPFGTLKGWMGSTHFLTKTLGRVSTEMSLHVLSYNMKRMINIVGIRAMMEEITA